MRGSGLYPRQVEALALVYSHAHPIVSVTKARQIFKQQSREGNDGRIRVLGSKALGENVICEAWRFVNEELGYKGRKDGYEIVVWQGCPDVAPFSELVREMLEKLEVKRRRS